MIYTVKPAKTILNPASGYLKGYSHTLNPYAGCSFRCSYCYVQRLPVALFRGETWGEWVDVKTNAANLLEKELKKAKRKGPVTIFMSSSTDPYQPIEVQEQITRSLLEIMVQNKPDFLFVQTRSPLVTRDIDLLSKLKDRVRVSITIETDLEEMRKIFTPSAPPVSARLNALKQIVDHGVPAQAAISPLLPSSEDFPNILRKIVDRVCIDDYFMGDGSQGKRTESLGIRQLYEQHHLEDWYSSTAYLRVLARLREVFRDDQLRISQAGFLP